MGSAWKQLPDDLSAPARRLTEELRAVKDATGLSLSELAARTHYSRASWERWLNGKRVITEQALDALISTVECDGPALRALWDLSAAAPGTDAGPASADAAGDAGDAGNAEDPAAEAPADAAGPDAAQDAVPQSAPEAAPDGQPGSGDGAGRTRRRPVALVAASVVVALLLALLGLRLLSSSDEGDAAAPTAATVPASAPTTPATPPVPVPANPAPPVPACQALGCVHKDPKPTGCGGDARTMLTTNVGKVVVYLRYSQKCQAAWASISEGQPGDQATITTSAGESETALIHWGYDNYSWMVNAADPTVTLQVCGQRKEPEGSACSPAVSDLARTVASTPIPPGPATPPATPAQPVDPAVPAEPAPTS
ncbi:DUF2690 domain-containing protein [Kitasatospora sp. NPDC058115]|uniref:helix-turn-helix domain-containing protein n=1 Tax=Kitasatospora sp. NPDC058115 TaxID=3346347 RepID=UPI0036D9EE19